MKDWIIKKEWKNEKPEEGKRERERWYTSIKNIIWINTSILVIIILD